MLKTLLPVLGVVSCLLGKVYFQKLALVAPPANPDLKPLLASYQSESVERYSLGFNNLIGAGIWVNLLQNSDYHPVKDEQVSWEFAQVDTLTTLDPNNIRAYDFGSLFISVLRRDKLGGKLLIEKWTKKQPHYWRPWYLLGSHYFLELHDYAAAAPLILKSSKMAGAPPWLSSLGIRLFSESGQLYQALKTSLELLPQLKDPESKSRIAYRIQSLNYRIQKRFWEEALENYLKKNKKPPTNMDELSQLIASKKRELSSLIEDSDDADLKEFVLSEKFTFKLDSSRKSIVSASPETTNSLENVGIFVESNSKEPKK
jgi:hypothetical protein